MAIVFISPQKKQRTFLWGVVIALVLFLIGLSSAVFLPDFLHQNPYTSVSPAYMPVITVNSDILDSNKVKNLQPTTKLELAFAYVVKDQNGQEFQGTISAENEDQAKNTLETSGITVVSLKEINIGRTNPFSDY